MTSTPDKAVLHMWRDGVVRGYVTECGLPAMLHAFTTNPQMFDRVDCPDCRRLSPSLVS